MVNAPPPPTQIITIVPANPQVVFVPIYHPVWAFGPWWHPAFPPFFFPPPPRWGWGVSVHVGIWWGPSIRVSNSLWGGVNWHRRDVNINVNRWNTINVNRRIDSRDRDVSWRHDVRNRHGVPYRGAAARDRLRPAVGDARARDEFRGRDLQRDRARQELANRVGAQNLDRNALRDIDRNRLPQRPGTSDTGGNVRDRAAGVDRGRLPGQATGIDRGRSRTAPPRSTGRKRRTARQASIAHGCRVAPAASTGRRRQNWNTSAAAINRDNALRGAGNAAQTRQQIDRGTASRGAMQQRASGAAGGAAARRR